MQTRRHAFQKIHRSIACGAGNFETGQFSTFDRHQLPSKLAGVAPLGGLFDCLITPAAGRANLCSQCVADRLLHGRLNSSIAGHGVGFAHRQRGHAVRVHVREHLRLAGQISVVALNADQIFQAALDVFRIVALKMRVARAEKRQRR